jgi:hypothetical protein
MGCSRVRISHCYSQTRGNWVLASRTVLGTAPPVSSSPPLSQKHPRPPGHLLIGRVLRFRRTQLWQDCPLEKPPSVPRIARVILVRPRALPDHRYQLFCSAARQRESRHSALAMGDAGGNLLVRCRGLPDRICEISRPKGNARRVATVTRLPVTSSTKRIPGRLHRDCCKRFLSDRNCRCCHRLSG